MYKNNSQTENVSACLRNRPIRLLYVFHVLLEWKHIHSSTPSLSLSLVHSIRHSLSVNVCETSRKLLTFIRVVITSVLSWIINQSCCCFCTCFWTWHNIYYHLHYLICISLSLCFTVVCFRTQSKSMLKTNFITVTPQHESLIYMIKLFVFYLQFVQSTEGIKNSLVW